MIEESIRRVVGEILGTCVEDDVPLMDAGIDSLSAPQLSVELG